MSLRTDLLLAAALAFTAQPASAAAPASANQAFDTCVRTAEGQLASQHASGVTFLSLPASDPSLRPSSLLNPVVDRLAAPEVPGALIHHWRATQFVPGARAADLDRLLKNFAAYPAVFAPQVERAGATAQADGRLHATMRVRQHHIITVVLDTDYDVGFFQLDPQHRYSISRSTQIREIEAPGTPAEHALPPGEDHGFLWRQNTYWSYAERDGGLYIQVESLSLTRAVPTGLGWAVGPYLESIPRDSLAFTLSCICTALSHGSPHNTR